MVTVTRQQISDCIDADELVHEERSEQFNRRFLWLWGAIVTNDTINVTPELKHQFRSMFVGWPNTIKALRILLGD